MAKNLKCKFCNKIIFVIFFYSISTFCFSSDKILIDKNSIIFMDGDTFACTKINSNEQIELRFLGVDTPETSNEEHGFLKDQYLGKEASEFTKKQVLSAKTISYIPYKNDIYGRTLAYIFVDEDLLAVKILQAGLGYENTLFYKNQNFDKTDEMRKFDEIIKASTDDIVKPNFMNPFFWRKKNRVNKSNNIA